MSRRQAGRAVEGKDYEWLDQALTYAETVGWIMRNGQGWKAGGSQPA
ncbi:MAG: hypothetical protein ACM30D_17080 [Hyphomicrobiales bacterium]